MSNKVFKNISVAFDYNGIEVQSKRKNKKRRKILFSGSFTCKNSFQNVWVQQENISLVKTARRLTGLQSSSSIQSLLGCRSETLFKILSITGTFVKHLWNLNNYSAEQVWKPISGILFGFFCSKHLPVQS